MLAVAIALEAVALVLFLTAGAVTVLLVARLVQGVATAPTHLVFALLLAGTVVTLGGVLAHSIALAFAVAGTVVAGTVVAGIGFGASALAVFGTLAGRAAPEQRGELFAVACTIAYLASSLPAVGLPRVRTDG